MVWRGTHLTASPGTQQLQTHQTQRHMGFSSCVSCRRAKCTCSFANGFQLEAATATRCILWFIGSSVAWRQRKEKRTTPPPRQADRVLADRLGASSCWAEVMLSDRLGASSQQMGCLQTDWGQTLVRQIGHKLMLGRWGASSCCKLMLGRLGASCC
jgi:hypothetical protein